MTSRTKYFKAALASLVMLTIFGISPVFGNTITVSNIGDSGAGSAFRGSGGKLHVEE
jgi:hypothetical protein